VGAIYLLYDITQSLETIVNERSCTLQDGKHVNGDNCHVKRKRGVTLHGCMPT
jgi:hypothetical protein